MTTSPILQAMRNKRTVLVFLAIAALLPITGVGVFAGALLSLMVLASLLLARNEDVSNRQILIGMAAIVLIENLVFMAGFFGAFAP